LVVGVLQESLLKHDKLHIVGNILIQGFQNEELGFEIKVVGKQRY